MLEAYVADYLWEEVAAEGLVRNLPAFSEFLDVVRAGYGTLGGPVRDRVGAPILSRCPVRPVR